MSRVISEEFAAHLASGATTTCRCWTLIRKDGQRLGFTDHDRELRFEDVDYGPIAGFNARVLQAGQGLSVDNSEIAGVLSSDRITEDDLSAGKYDGAEIYVWLVNWAKVDERQLQFRGNLGEVTYDNKQFTVEMRSLSDRLNAPVGRSYLKQCTAQAGDTSCKHDVEGPNFVREAIIKRAEGHKLIYLEDQLDLPDDWFAYGRLEVLDGPNAGKVVRVFSDRVVNSERRIELAEDLYFEPVAGERVNVVAGCDGRFETCVAKFDNAANFKGFPFLPGDDWMMAYPKRSQEDE